MLILLCWNLNWAYALPYIMWLHSCTRVAGLAALTATQINTCCCPWAPGNAITHLFCLFGCWFTRPKSLQAQCTSFQLCWWWSLCDCNMAKLLIAKMQVLSVVFFSQLHHCNMNSSGQCPFCSGEETCLHLFITYQQSSSFWSFTNIDLRSLPLSEGIESFWQIMRIRMTVLLCITWNAWRCRNANIFRHEDEANTHISRRGRDDLHFFSFGPIDVVTPGV